MKRLTDDEIRQNVKNTLIQLRLQHDLTQTDVGKLVGKSKTAVASWEQGQSSPDIQTLFKLADYYGVSIDYMYGLEKTDKNDFVDMKYTDDPLYPIDLKVTRGEYRLILEMRGRREIDQKTLEEMFNTIIEHKLKENSLKLKDNEHMQFRITVDKFLKGDDNNETS